MRAFQYPPRPATALLKQALRVLGLAACLASPPPVFVLTVAGQGDEDHRVGFRQFSD